MATKSPRAAKKRATVKKQECTAIFEEVEKFEDLAPRMHELLLTSPRGQEFIFAFEIAEQSTRRVPDRFT